MAIEKRFIHFKKFSDFNSKKLSANEANTQYTVGISGEIQNGSPDVLYQSYVWIKDTQQQWTHGQIYNGRDVDIDTSQFISKDDVDAALSETSTNPVQNQAVMNTLLEWEAVLIDLFDHKQPVITDLDAIRDGAAKGATSVQPSDIKDVARKDSGYVMANGILDENDGYWYLPKNSLNDKEHTLASKSDIEEKILVIGDSSDEAKANFIAVANGEKTADVYIGSVDVEGYIIEGCVKLAMSGSSSDRMYSFAIIGNPTSGRYINKFIKVTCLFANGAISSEVEVIDAYSKPSTGIPKTDLDTSVQASLGKADTAVQPADIKDDVYIADFTMYSLRIGMKSGTNVDCDVRALVDAMNANKVILVREDEDSAYKGVHTLNGFAEDLLYFSIVDSSGNILWCEGTNYTDASYIDAQTLYLHNWWEKQDTLVSGENIKTINGESILGSGDITIESGSGTITGVSANGTSIATSGVANIPAATTSKYGVTKLSSATNSTSTSLAATASAVKSAYDLANGRQAKLVSGTNIKTINNTSILGSGNIAIDANIQAVDTQETLDDVNTNTYVKYVAQTLTEDQKAQVRENIGIIDNNNNYIAWDSVAFEMGNAYYMAPNKKYICTLPLTYLTFIEGTLDDTWHNNVTDLYNEYTVIFECNETQIETPNSWIWANGSIPTLENGVRYELSISLMYINNQYLTHAVLVPFKSV